LRQIALRDPDSGFDGRDGSHVREEARTVQLFGLVQELDRPLRVTVGPGEESLREEPAVAALGHRPPVGESGRGLEVLLGALEVSNLDVHLAQPHVQLSGCPRHAWAVCLGETQRLRAQLACLARPAGREPQVTEYDSAAQLVDEAAGGVQAGHRLGERLQRVRHVARGPRGEAEKSSRSAAREMVVRAGQVQRAPGVFRRGERIAAGLGERCPVDGDGGREGLEVIGVSPRESRAFGYGRQRTFRVSEPRLDLVQVAGGQEHGSVEDTEHWIAPYVVVGQELQPAVHHRVLPVSSHRRHSQLHQVDRSLEVLSSQRVLDRLFGQIVALEPMAGTLVQQWNLIRLLADQTRPQHVGEQLVVAVPLPPVVQGNEEQIGPVQRHQHVASVIPAGDGVTQQPSHSVENR